MAYSSFDVVKANAFIGPQPLAVVGQVYYVSSSSTVAPDGIAGSNSNSGKSPKEPFATIDYAVGRCTANRGDVIVVGPGHTETVIAAAGLDLDVAGITLIGVGNGDLRPTINYTTAVGADMDVDAADISMINFLFTGGIDALTGPIDVNSDDFKLVNCEWKDVTGQATDVIVANGVANLLIDGLTYNGAAAAGTNAGIALTNCTRPTIRKLVMDGNFAVGGIDIRTTASTDLHVHDVRFRTRNAADIFLVDTITGSTGIIGPNIYIRVVDNAANITEAITGATFVVMDDVYVVNLAGEKAMLINWVASTDA